MSPRVFAIGIGSNVDRDLVRKLAEAGQGLYEFVDGRDRSIESKVMSTMNAALTQTYVEWELPAGMSVKERGEMTSVRTGLVPRKMFWAILQGKVSHLSLSARRLGLEELTTGQTDVVPRNNHTIITAC